MADIKRVIRATVDLNEPIQKTIMRDLFVTESKNAHEFRIKLMRGGAPVPLDDVIVSGFFTRYRDMVSCVLSGSVQDDEIVMTLSTECYDQRTVFSVTIAVENTDTRTPVFVGEGQMVANRSDTVYDPEGYVPSLQDILSQYELMQKATEDTAAAAQDARDAAFSAGIATDTALYAAASIDGMTVDAYDAGSAQVSVTTVDGVKHISFGLPKGDTGEPLRVVGVFDTLPDLTDAYQYGLPGDAAIVGSFSSAMLYVWDQFNNGWVAVGRPGAKGDKGDPGEPGYTPVRGVDYWTETDQKIIVDQVLYSLPNASELGVTF